MTKIAIYAAIAAAATAGLWSTASDAARTPPAGSYQQSCNQVTLSNGGILSAQCRDRSGRNVPASLNVASCGPGDIGNNDGRLTCQPAFGRPNDRPPGRGPGGGRGPGRYGPASIILYEAGNFQGRSVELHGDIDRLDYENFNDIASSIKVNGGEWQICTAAQYRGNCVVIRRDVPNLNQFQMNDQISSLRRIG